MFSTAHLRPYSKHERVIDFFAPIPSDFTGTPDAGVTAGLIGAEVAGGPGLRVSAASTAGGYTLLGTAINPTTTKAALVELDGITHVGTTASWTCGWESATNVAFIGRAYDSGRLRSTIAGSATTTLIQGGNSVMVNGHAGLFLDFVNGDMIGHVNSSYSQLAAPTANETLTFGLRVGSAATYTLTFKRIRLTVWA